MKTNKIIRPILIFFIGLIGFQNINAQKDKKKMKETEYEVVVNVSPERAWEVLANYGNVGDILFSVKRSFTLEGANDTAKLNYARECAIPNKKKDLIIRERIIDISEGNYYTYDVYEWENFPLTVHDFLITFGVKTTLKGETVIYQKSNYRFKSWLITFLMKGKLKKGMRETLISYKHYMETGEPNVDTKILKKKYKKA